MTISELQRRGGLNEEAYEKVELYNDYTTLVNVYVDLVVFTRMAGTS